MTTIIVPDQEWGTPWGSYDVRYYTLRGDGRVTLDPGGDSDVDGRRIEKMTPPPNEAIKAVCRSHPHLPVTWVYGSERMQRAMDKYFQEIEEERARREAEPESNFTDPSREFRKYW